MTWELLAGIAGGIVLLGNAGAMIYKWIRPALQVKETVEELDKRSKRDAEAIQKLEAVIDQNERVNRLYLKAMLNIINHMIDGNNVNAMKETRKDIEDLLAGVGDAK